MAAVAAQDISERILAANPVLEAFGNSKTVRNNNSSRFGKWMKIRFHRIDENRIEMIGCHTDHYLLEKARLVSHDPEERSFHIFYQLLASSDTALKEELSLASKTTEDFSFLSASSDSAGVIDDTAEFDVTKGAFKKMGFEDKTVKEILIILSGLLHLGNVDFVDMEDDDQVHASETCTADLNTCALLLGLQSPDRLAKALSTKERVIQRETIASPLTAVQSSSAR